MQRFSVKLSLVACVLLSSAACTQRAAQVELRGSNTYSSRNDDSGAGSSFGGKSAYKPASVYTNTQRPVFASEETYSSVYVDPIQRTDLPAPQAASSPASVAAEPQSADSRVSPWRNPFSSPSTETQPVQAQEVAPAAPEKTQEVALYHDDEVVEPLQKEVAEPLQKEVAELEPAASNASGFVWPVGSKKIISSFSSANNGISIATGEGEPIWAAADGEVVTVGNDSKGLGNMVVIRHSGNKSTTYAHMSRATVDKYDRVKQGDIIGYVGKSGNVNQPQLHFAIREGQQPVDPQKFLSNKVAGL